MSESGKGNHRTGRPPTLANVAELAGVSISTAARVLRGADYPVDDRLANAVRKAAREVGYVPNVLARSLRGGGPAMIGLIVGDMLDPYYGEIAETVTVRSESVHGLAAIVSNMQRDPLLELRYCQRFWERRCAGLILAGGGFDQQTNFDAFAGLVRQMTEAGIHVTTLSPRGLEVPVFCIDNRAAGRAMAAHLVRHGHRKVGILLGPPLSQVTQERLTGAVDALREGGAGFEVIHADYTSAAGAGAVASIFEREPGLTGLIVGSTSMAMGVVGWLRQSGRSVPQDVSVIGIGPARAAGWITPTLTVVDPALDACGAAAIDYIAARVSGTNPPVPPEPPVRLVPGGSVATV